MSVMITY